MASRGWTDVDDSLPFLLVHVPDKYTQLSSYACCCLNKRALRLAVSRSPSCFLVCKCETCTKNFHSIASGNHEQAFVVLFKLILFKLVNLMAHEYNVTVCSIYQQRALKTWSLTQVWGLNCILDVWLKRGNLGGMLRDYNKYCIGTYCIDLLISHHWPTLCDMFTETTAAVPTRQRCRVVQCEEELHGL